MKKRKDRWTGVSPEARRSYILARHRLTFEQWCTVVQARLNIAKSRLEKRILGKNVPKALKGLPVVPKQVYEPTITGFFGKLFHWLKEFFAPAIELPIAK